MIRNIRKYWERNFAGFLPLAHTFRDAFKDRWVRFHSLPESKRYAESESEYQTILLRHNTVITRLCQEKKLILITAFYSENIKPEKKIGRGSLVKPFDLDLNSKYWQTVAMHEVHSDFEPELYLHLFASEWNWSPTVFDQILKLAADDVLSNVFILSLESNWIYHPYDGGADVICASISARNLIHKEFSNWLSDTPGGL